MAREGHSGLGLQVTALISYPHGLTLALCVLSIQHAGLLQDPPGAGGTLQPIAQTCSQSRTASSCSACSVVSCSHTLLVCVGVL